MFIWQRYRSLFQLQIDRHATTWNCNYHRVFQVAYAYEAVEEEENES